MPSAKEVQSSGIALGEMVKLQQKKIEELTLYLLEQNKLLNKQSLEIRQLKASMNKLNFKK